jgi:copper chaperone NosL
MKNIWPRALLILAGLMLLTLFVFPMWKIILYAPQYPDGVHMYIYVNKIGGRTAGTLQNVNILNHYIGMKPIVPDAIPELKYFPYFVIGFTVLAVLFALIDWRPLYFIWLGLLIIALILAMYDFYLWEYDYGHNLDPNAPMKFEDESFQPPLFGKKVLLNFIAYSLPHIGGYFIIGSVLLASLATYLRTRTSVVRQ